MIKKQIMIMLCFLVVLLAGCSNEVGKKGEIFEAEKETTVAEITAKKDEISQVVEGTEVFIPEGTITDTQFVNDAIGVTLNIPEGWHHLDDETLKMTATQSDPSGNTSMQFIVSKDDMTTTPVTENINFVIQTKEYLKEAVSIKNNDDFYFINRVQIEQVFENLGYKVTLEDNEVINISDKDIVAFSAIIEGEITIYQEYYMIEFDDYYGAVTVTYYEKDASIAHKVSEYLELK